ncbi:MAG TPA: crossover junction endodeoxyribonuclease RuvC [Gemmatimonadaceae bacterium]
MIILGVDPGTGVTGYGVVRSVGGSYSLLECGVIRTSAAEPLHTRLHEIHQGITDLIARHQPQALAVEDVFYSRNVRTTVVLGHARGVVLLAGAHAGLEVAEYPPAEIKKAVAGNGAATKPQVQFMVTQLLRLKSAPEPADASDGVAVALTHAMSAHLRRIAEVARTPVTRVPLAR